jgi:uncharacterized damage-inducible protein DinB
MIYYGAAQLAASFRTVRDNTIRIAEEIPEDAYGREIAPGMSTIAGAIAHIALSPRMRYDMHETRRVTTLVGYDFPGILATLRAEEATPRSKEELVALLRSEGTRIADWLASLDEARLAVMVTDPVGTGAKSTFEHLLSIKEHEMHHRAQLMVAQRMLGLVPHTTRAMAERRAAAELARQQREAKAAAP